MSVHRIWKRLITNQVRLSSHLLYIRLLPPFAFNAKPNIKITHFCTEIANASPSPPPIAFNAKPNTKSAPISHLCTLTVAPSTTPVDWGVFRDFLLNKCGFTDEDIIKVFGNRNGLLRKSIQNLEEVLEMLYGCGLTTPSQIRKVVFLNPGVFFYKSETKVKTMLNLLRTFLKEEHVCKLVYNQANVLSVGEHKVKSRISLLQKLGVEGEFLSLVLARQPRLLTYSEVKVMEVFKQADNLGVKNGSKAFLAALCTILGAGKEKIERKLQCLRSLGFSEKEIMEISTKKPFILGQSQESLKHHVEFVVHSVGLPLGDLVKHAALFTCSVEKRMIPRYRVMEALKSMQMLKTKMSLPQIFKLSERSFLEKYVHSNAVSSSVLRDIYHGGKAGEL